MDRGIIEFHPLPDPDRSGTEHNDLGLRRNDGFILLFVSGVEIRNIAFKLRGAGVDHLVYGHDALFCPQIEDLFFVSLPEQSDLPVRETQFFGGNEFLRIPGSSFGYSGTMVETTKRITEFDSEAIILNTPSDHILTPDYKFIEAVFTAVINAEKGYVSAIGVKTNSLDTVMACGNIIYDQEKLNNGITISKDFIEKPGITRARELIKNDMSVCNTGICVWRADALLEYAPKNTKDLTTERLMRAFNGHLRIVVGEFQWQDCGTLRGLYSALDKMPHTQNVVLGEGKINLDNSCKRSLFYADKGLSLNVSDTSDCAIIFTKVHNQPVLLISHLDESQKIKELAEDYSRHEKILIDDFSLGARNNRVLYSNMYYEYSVGFVNVEDYIVHIVRRSDYGDIEAEIFKKKSTSTK